MLLLDTHVWVWALEGEARRLGRRTRTLLTRAGGQDAVRVSPVSVFEVTALHTLGRLRFTVRPEAWIREAFAVPGIRIAELSASAAADAGSITRDALPDPLDRLLVATARDADATLVTCDERILTYAATDPGLRVHDARR
ncbi:MAG: PIN domain-containing protein [Vicinamibacterales bacterium]